jgi:hypothetical protein
MGTFDGRPFYENLLAQVPNNTFSFGTNANPFASVGINSGTFGHLDLSTNGVFPLESIDLGTETRKFHYLFA